MKQVYYKQNEKFEYEFFNDKECKEAFEFNGEDKNLYIELKNGDITPAIALDNKCPYEKIDGFILYVCGYVPFFANQSLIIALLNAVECDYSKYIPNDCALVFLDSEEEEFDGMLRYKDGEILDYDKRSIEYFDKIMLYTKELTSTNIKQINDTAKVLKEKYGIEWVGVFAELCFADVYILQRDEDKILCYTTKERPHRAIYLENLNKLITTNATGLFEPLERELLQVIDCKEIFEEYIKTNE